MYATTLPSSTHLCRLGVYEQQMHLVLSHEKDLYLRNPNHLPEFFNELRNAKPEKNLNPYQKKARPFQPIIHSTAKRYELEPAIIQAIIMAESGFNPNAVSYRGAQGLMQLMPRTARYLGVEDSFNPQHNIEGGVKYFKRLLNRFNGDIELALAAYNAGSRNVHKYKGVPPFSETKTYIEKVLKYYEAYKTT
jgi:soluble lytic murein transglycosylase-like protein